MNGVFRYREHNSTGEGSEEMMVAPSKDREELLVGAADTLARAGEPVLYSCRTGRPRSGWLAGCQAG